MSGRPADAPDLAAIAAELASRDPALSRVIDATGPPALRDPADGNFAALVRAITYQQLAGRAAASIHGRFVAAMPDGVTAETVLDLPDETFRSAGLSAAKTASIRDLAARTAGGSVPLDAMDGLDDAEVVALLTEVRGIGRWTAEMFLIFQLRRLDVWPVDDLGVRKGYGLVHGVDPPPAPKALQELGEAYRPYRSIAAWYMWRAVDTTVPA